MAEHTVIALPPGTTAIGVDGIDGDKEYPTFNFSDGSSQSEIMPTGFAGATVTNSNLTITSMTFPVGGYPDSSFRGSPYMVDCILGISTAIFLGDINGDGLVDVADYNIWAADVGATGATWSQGDLNGDGLVDVADYNIWAANVGNTASTPEPATLSPLVLGGLQCGRRK